MAALSLSPSAVLKSSEAESHTGILAAAVTAGQSVCRLANGTFTHCDIDSVATDELAGIAIQGGAVGQPFLYVKRDPALDLGTSSTLAGLPCFALSDGGLSVTPADVAVGDRTNVAGVFNDDGTLNLSIVIGGTKV